MLVRAVIALSACTGTIEQVDDEPPAVFDTNEDSSVAMNRSDASAPDDSLAPETEPMDDSTFESADASVPDEEDMLEPDSELESSSTLMTDDPALYVSRRLRGAAKKQRDAGTPPPPTVDAGIDAGITPPPTGTVGIDTVWTPLSVTRVLDPMAYGAVGNGTTDDLNALTATVNALPANGGIIYFPSGKVFKKTNVLLITKSHVKLWATNRDSEIFSSIAGQRRHQAILCRSTNGCGVFGLKLRSDATSRFDALEDHHVAADRATLTEVVGNEVQSSAAVGICFTGTTEDYVEGNYIHHTWADHIHHTGGAATSWVWNNYINNASPSKGDDGVACVTYGANGVRCNDMEWWKNTILHTDWGRGFSVIGGNNILIHDNWAIGVAGAGIIVASEPSYDTSASQGISVTRNYIANSGHTIGHPGMLISGMSTAAGPLRDIALSSNIVVNVPAGTYRVEGSYQNVTNTNLATSGLPAMPTTANIVMADTRVMRTRDTSWVAAESRAGLHRIHVRRAPSGSGFQQRFEYVVKGSQDAVAAFVQQRANAKDYVSETRLIDGTAYALVLCAAPVTIPSTLTGVTFRELREQDRTGKLSWLWQRVDSGAY